MTQVSIRGWRKYSAFVMTFCGIMYLSICGHEGGSLVLSLAGLYIGGNVIKEAVSKKENNGLDRN